MIDQKPMPAQDEEIKVEKPRNKKERNSKTQIIKCQSSRICNRDAVEYCNAKSCELLVCSLCFGSQHTECERSEEIHLERYVDMVDHIILYKNLLCFMNSYYNILDPNFGEKTAWLKAARTELNEKWKEYDQETRRFDEYYADHDWKNLAESFQLIKENFITLSYSDSVGTLSVQHALHKAKEAMEKGDEITFSTLEAKLAQALGEKIQSDKLSRLCHSLESKLANKNSKVKDLTTQLSDLNKLIEDHNSQLEAKDTEINTHQEEIKQCEEAKEELKKEITQKDEEYKVAVTESVQLFELLIQNGVAFDLTYKLLGMLIFHYFGNKLEIDEKSTLEIDFTSEKGPELIEKLSKNKVPKLNEVNLTNVPTGNANLNNFFNVSIKNPIEALVLDAGTNQMYSIHEYTDRIGQLPANLKNLHIKGFNVPIADLQTIVDAFLAGTTLHFIECVFPDLAETLAFGGAADSPLQKLVFRNCKGKEDKLNEAEKGFVNTAITNAGNFTVAEYH